MAKAPPVEKPDRSKAPAGGPAPRIDLPKPTRFALASGAKLLVVERHTLPIVTVHVVWTHGLTDDPAGRFGLAGLAADLLEEGTTTRDASRLAADLEKIGARLGAGASWDATSVSLTSLTRRLDDALPLLADVIAHPAFDAKELERLRAEKLAALQQQRDSASAVAGNVLGAVLYPGSRFSASALGDEAGLKAISRDDVVRYYAAAMRPSDATVIVVGDVTPDDLRARLDKALAEWKDASPTVAPHGKPAAAAPASRLVLVDKPGAPQTELRVGEAGPPRNTPDYFALLVLNQILGGNFTSRLNMNLREAHGYTYGARSSWDFRREGGPFTVAAPVKTEVTAAALGEALGEIARIGAKEVSPEELRLSKDLLERAMARRFETTQSVAAELSSIVVYDLPDDFLSTFGDKIEAVTAADVERVAHAHIDPAHETVLLVGDLAKVQPTLGALHLPAAELRDVEGRPIVAPKPAATKPAPAPSPPRPQPPRKSP